MKFTTSTVVLRQLDEKQGEVLVVCSFCSLVFTEHKGSSLKGGKEKSYFMYILFIAQITREARLSISGVISVRPFT